VPDNKAEWTSGSFLGRNVPEPRSLNVVQSRKEPIDHQDG
jgi:hypothetical protein